MIGDGCGTRDGVVGKGSRVVYAYGIDGRSPIINGFGRAFRGTSTIGISSRGCTGNDVGRVDAVTG